MNAPNSLIGTPVRILEPEMRKLFNEGTYVERLACGELLGTVLEQNPAPLRANEPPGTLSQMVSYRDKDDNEVARVHQYLRPDGTIGASGKPDPKRLLHNGTLYRLVRKRDRTHDS
jgi:hypothetical protein